MSRRRVAEGRARVRRPRRPAASRVVAGTRARGDRVVNGRIYDEPRPDDGERVLVMRLWPRGVRKTRVSRWLRELGPEKPLMQSFLRGETSWDEYRRRYLTSLGRPEAQAALAELRRLAQQQRVTLLCWCPDEQRCHRSLLREHVLRHVL